MGLGVAEASEQLAADVRQDATVLVHLHGMRCVDVYIGQLVACACVLGVPTRNRDVEVGAGALLRVVVVVDGNRGARILLGGFLIVKLSWVWRRVGRREWPCAGVLADPERN